MKALYLTTLFMFLSFTITLSQTVNPEILWATYFGSPGEDYTGGVVTDKEGNIYIVSAVQADAPTTAGVHKTYYSGGISDVMLTKFDKDGALIWSTYFGGNGSDDSYNYPRLLSDGSIAICGSTTSTNGIASLGAHKISYGGSYDNFLAVFEPNGKLRWSTYFGGIGEETEPSISVDLDDNIFLTGYSTSKSGITSDGAFQKQNNGGYDGTVAKFNKTGKQLWCTYYGGSGSDYFWTSEVDKDGNLYVGGSAGSSQLASIGAFKTTYGGNSDGLLVKFDQNGQRIWSTYFGSGGKDDVYYLNIDSKDNIYIMGATTSTGGIASTGAYSTVNSGNEDVFLAKFDKNGNRLWSTYIGGEEWETIFGCDFDNDDNIYLSILTKSQAFTTTEDVPTTYHSGGIWDAAFVKFSPSGELKWSTYFGGDGNDRALGIALDQSQNIVATINSDSKGLATPGAYDEVANGNESLLIKFRDATIVDVKEIALMPELQIFPNPATTYFEIPNDLDEIRNISIYNASGEVVKRYLHTNKDNFDISQLPVGMYYIICNTKGINAATKLIKIN